MSDSRQKRITANHLESPSSTSDSLSCKCVRSTHTERITSRDRFAPSRTAGAERQLKQGEEKGDTSRSSVRGVTSVEFAHLCAKHCQPGSKPVPADSVLTFLRRCVELGLLTVAEDSGPKRYIPTQQLMLGEEPD